MTDILIRSSDARDLARRLSEFFEFRLMCRLPPGGNKEPSRARIKIDEFLRSHKPGDLSPEVVICDGPRREEALVHELLHLNLIRLGYPRFRIIPKDDKQWDLAGGIINIADHHVILPIFKSFGYSEDQFLGPSQPHTPLEKRVHKNLEERKDQLFSPEGYGLAISDYLQVHSIKYEIVWIANMIQSRVTGDR